MTLRGDAMFFLGILAFIFLIWLATGGPSRPISFAGPYLTPITTVGDRSEAYGDHITGDSIKSSLFDSTNDLKDLEEQLKDARVFGEVSPYRGQVTLSRSSSGARATNSRDEYIAIQHTGRTDEDIYISGWQVVSVATGNRAIIPLGTKTIRTGQLNQTAAIALSSGDDAILTSGRSPTGLSFKENMCTGYLEQNQTFEPGLSNSCPAPDEEFETYYANALSDDACYEYITDELDQCVAQSNPPRRLSSGCRSFVEDRLSYNGCVNTHQYESDFSEDTWRIYLGSSKELWKQERESIKLLDAQGKTVDLITY